MESTKQEIECGPYSSGVIGLGGGVFSCGHSNDPSSDKKAVASLRSTCFVHLLIS